MIKYFDSHETGDVLSRVTNDIDTIAQNMNQSFATLVSSITIFLGSILMMFITNWIMALTAIIASLIGFGVMGLFMGMFDLTATGITSDNLVSRTLDNNNDGIAVVIEKYL